MAVRNLAEPQADEIGFFGPVSRRQLFRLTAAAGASTALPALVHGQSADPGYVANEKWLTPESRLVRRITYGATEAELNHAKRLGFDRYLNYQLAQRPDANSILKEQMKRIPELGWTPKQLWDDNTQWDTVQKFFDFTIARKVLSNAQLFERMVEFWSDHFNIFIFKDSVAGLKIVDDRDVIRRLALGKVPDLLRASAKSPAMLYYLDNAFSDKKDPNQNYARELMELHTLGVDGGYTQEDVIEVARCFTGWRFEWNDASPRKGTYVYDHGMHDDGAKKVLGVTIPSGGGVTDGYTVLDILANHPSTAIFIAKKLTKWFLGEVPPAGVITAVAAKYTETKGDIVSMLRVILTPSNVMAAPVKIKRPMHAYVSAVRAIQPTPNKFIPIQWAAEAAGHGLFTWEPPNGYPDVGNYWAGGILARAGFAAWLIYGMEGLEIPLERLTGGLSNPTAIVNRINQILHGGEMPAAEYQALVAYINKFGYLDQWVIKETWNRALSSPSFQCY